MQPSLSMCLHTAKFVFSLSDVEEYLATNDSSSHGIRFLTINQFLSILLKCFLRLSWLKNSFIWAENEQTESWLARHFRKKTIYISVSSR